LAAAMSASSIGAGKAGGYARYLESRTVAPERGNATCTIRPTRRGSQAERTLGGRRGREGRAASPLCVTRPAEGLQLGRIGPRSGAPMGRLALVGRPRAPWDL